MQEYKEVIIKDGGEDRKFRINKFTALHSYYFMNKLLGLVCKGNPELPDMTPETFKQSVHNLMGTGVRVENADVPNIVNNQLMAIFSSVIRSAFAQCSEADQEWILLRALAAVTYVRNSESVVPCTLDNIDIFAKNGITLHKVIWEVIKYNYDFFSIGNGLNSGNESEAESTQVS